MGPSMYFVHPYSYFSFFASQFACL